MKKSIKVLLTVLALAVVLSVTLAFSIGAEDSTKTPEIISQNVYYDNQFSLMYAVSEDSVNNGPVTLNIYYEYPTEGVEVKHSYVAQTPETITRNGEDVSAYVFVTNGVAAKNLTDYFYAVAVDNTGAKSEVKRYSVIEYMYERLSGQQSITESQTQLYRTVIEFASWSTQVIDNEKDNDTTNDEVLAIDYSYVFFPAGDGFIRESQGETEGYNAGTWPKGTVVYPYIPDATNLTVTIYNDDMQPAGSTVIKNATALTLSGDTTVITAGGELSYVPDLTDTQNRLTFEADLIEEDFARLSLNLCGYASGIVDAAPYGVSSKVYKLICNTSSSGNEEINYQFGKNVSKPTTATKFIVEVDLMLELTGSGNATLYAQFRGDSIADEWRIRGNYSDGKVILAGLSGYSDIEAGEVGKWFRYKLVYTKVDDNYIVEHYINDELIATDETMKTTSYEILNMNRFRMYADSGANCVLYSDNVKVWFE